ncbi:TAXI family TRAP transporter solute-binding subunit [Microvirga splendida]|uniref:TAXI family TRAP transporter solute-binding subunit n=1 Tax=Microvirga splendida TaxID=2795727 RepID=A0ABS0XYQ4_9HYPH|nr:TAXI family TRAP transporter solute-binding subunit [Microvirga splendida]MBJ6125181.1 TAXI family TRAP transporter solute-binding subunit [Microvirga splendida]
MSGRVSVFSSMRDCLSRPLVWAAAIAGLLASGLAPAAAQTAPAFNPSRANTGTLGVISGGADGTYIRIAADLANVLDGEDLRVLPMIGRGSLQNLRDIMFLRGVDIGIVQMDAREQLKAEKLQDSAVRRLRFITRLYNEEVHIIANREITDIRQLDGKKVNIDKAGSGTNLTSRLIFEKLGIKPEVTTFDQASSYAKLKSGEIQAAVYVAGRPVRAIAEFQTDGRFHLLPIPFEGEIAESYFPARFANADYPRLVDADKPVETLAVGSLLAVFNWPENSDRYNRVKRFVDAFFSRFDEFLQPGRHPKWKEVNLAADVPGWERVKPAQDWLDRAASARTSSPQVQSFESFMNNRGINVSAQEREVLFREFLAWQGNRERALRKTTTRQD